VRYPKTFWVRRRVICPACDKPTRHAVEHHLTDVTMWWCVRCGGTTSPNGYLRPLDPAREITLARARYLSIPYLDPARARAYRAWLRHASANDHAPLGSAA
jgi:ribosomal protein L37AE/L43A